MSNDVSRRRLLESAAGTGVALSLGDSVAATRGGSTGREREVLVGVSDGSQPPTAAVESHLPAGASILHESRTVGYVTVRLPDASEREAFAASVTDHPRVTYVEPNATYRVAYTPDDPQFSSQYVPQQIGADDAWDTTLGDCDCSIAVVDTGVDCSHPDLCYCNAVGYDFVDDDADPSPDDPYGEFHGTHVAGIATARTDNGTGIAGVADASLLVARALDENGVGSTSDIARAIEWAADQGADVVLLGFGGTGYSPTLEDAISYARGKDALVVGAAGNAGRPTVAYPAAYDEVLAVSAVDDNENLAYFSNVSPEIELAAPGVDVLSTTTNARGSYGRLSGTSMAAAAVAGVAALGCTQWNPTSDQLRRHLKATATDVGLAPGEQGCGQVDAAAVVGVDPANSGTCPHGAGGPCGQRSDTETISGSVGPGGTDCWSRSWTYPDPCEVVVSLDGPSGTNFDLYLEVGTGNCPTTTSYTHVSRGPYPDETITVTEPNASWPLSILVYARSGSGSYDLTVTEKAT